MRVRRYHCRFVSLHVSISSATLLPSLKMFSSVLLITTFCFQLSLFLPAATSLTRTSRSSARNVAAPAVHRAARGSAYRLGDASGAAAGAAAGAVSASVRRTGSWPRSRRQSKRRPTNRASKAAGSGCSVAAGGAATPRRHRNRRRSCSVHRPPHRNPSRRWRPAGSRSAAVLAVAGTSPVSWW